MQQGTKSLWRLKQKQDLISWTCNAYISPMHVLKLSSKYGQLKRALTNTIENTFFCYIRKHMAARFLRHQRFLETQLAVLFQLRMCCARKPLRVLKEKHNITKGNKMFNQNNGEKHSIIQPKTYKRTCWKEGETFRMAFLSEHLA